MKIPLEAAGYRRYSTSPEIAEFLQDFAAAHGARAFSIGSSVRGQPIIALKCEIRDRIPDDPIRILLVGSHHGGAEPAGGDAMLALARNLLAGPLQSLLRGLSVIIVPNVNPDGRDLGTSKNANQVNLNRDFVLLSQPESRALNALLREFSPHVVLDAHESAVLKRKTLGQEGYMTDFEAQFDVGNNPAIPSVLLDYAANVMLPALIQRVSANGLPAQRYIREIGSTTQALTHGGLTMHCFRNRAGLHGALSVLLENRMDPSDGVYASYRNIASRCSKQLLCLRAFLEVIQERGGEIRAITESSQGLEPGQLIALGGEYAEHPRQPQATLRLRKIPTGEPMDIAFRDHRHIVPEPAIALPERYYVMQHQDEIAKILRRHGIAFEVLSQPRRAAVVLQRVYRTSAAQEDSLQVEEWEQSLQIRAGALATSTAQPQARLVPLLLDARSGSSLVRNPPFSSWIKNDAEPFICRQTE